MKSYGPEMHKYLIKNINRPLLEYVDSGFARKKIPGLIIDYFEEEKPWSHFNRKAVAIAEKKRWKKQQQFMREAEMSDDSGGQYK